jgi:RNA polymerase primary sigma factor
MSERDDSREYQFLPVDTERELAERIKRGDTAARTQLVLDNLSLVVSIASRYRSDNLSFEDLVQEGNLGLIRASRTFDPTLTETTFSIYATIWIKSYIHRTVVTNDSLIRIPEHLHLLRRRFRRAMGLLRKPGRSGIGSLATEQSSIEQIAGSMGIPPCALRSSRFDVIKRDRLFESEEYGGTRALAEAMGDCRRPEEEVVAHEVRDQLDAALRQLNPVEAWVIRERYGLHTSTADHKTRAAPFPHAHHGATADRNLKSRTDHSLTNRSRRGRTYAELTRDCGLSVHRLRQVERAALDKLRCFLGSRLNQGP